MFVPLWIWEQHKSFEQTEYCSLVHMKELVNHQILQSSFLWRSYTFHRGSVEAN